MMFLKKYTEIWYFLRTRAGAISVRPCPSAKKKKKKKIKVDLIPQK